ncbi:transposase, partial [Clostridium butyricum]
ATKYINHYYNFYSLIDSEKVFDYMSIFFDLLKNGSYTSVEGLRTNHIEDY